MDKSALCRAAIKARKNAYAPYSGYRVGAALLTESGTVFTGVNVENASYGATICAERSAVVSALSAGENRFIAIAVAGGKGEMVENVAPPCGICRQVLSEFCPPDFPLLLVTGENTFSETTLKELLPMSFGNDQLK